MLLLTSIAIGAKCTKCQMFASDLPYQQLPLSLYLQPNPNPLMDNISLLATARLTGLWYLLLAIFGILGFLWLHPLLFIAGDPELTLQNLTANPTQARARLALELGIVASQALAAVWFYKLFKDIHHWAAFATAGWGLLNAAAILVSGIAMGTAIDMAAYTGTSASEKLLVIEMLTQMAAKAWSLGGLFFGLWLMPMGYAVIQSGRMPLWMGRMLLAGGIGYILSTFLATLGISHVLVEALTFPATIGEFWMIGYLFAFGLRPVER